MYTNNKRGKTYGMLIAVLMTALVTGFLVYMVTSGYVSQSIPKQKEENPTKEEVLPEATTPQIERLGVEDNPLTRTESIPTSVAKSALPGVVGISVLKAENKALFEGTADEAWGVGSGVIVSSEGYILTNHHVAGGKNKRIVVSIPDVGDVDGVTTWSDAVMDLAIVKVNTKQLKTIPLGDAGQLQVGEPAIAIGNPLGLQLQRTVTSGVISALNRTIRITTEQGENYMEDLIQTDASINPGNSGGPLLNAKGEVVGINTIKVTGAEAIGFAVPINIVIPIIKKLTNGGNFKEPYLGIFAYDRDIIPYVNGNQKVDKGIYVSNVDEDAPAYKAGIKIGCIIKQVDGKDINTMMQLREYLYQKNPGDTIQVTHLAHETQKVMTVSLVLQEKKKEGLITR